MTNVDDRDLVYEYASHRVQAALAMRWGLRDFMAVTTDWRPYWDALPDNPLADGDDPAIAIALDAFDLAKLKPFAEVLNRALAATAAIADVVRDAAGSDSLWSRTKACAVVSTASPEKRHRRLRPANGLVAAGSQNLRSRIVVPAEPVAGRVLRYWKSQPRIRFANCIPNWYSYKTGSTECCGPMESVWLCKETATKQRHIAANTMRLGRPDRPLRLNPKPHQRVAGSYQCHPRKLRHFCVGS